MYFMDYYIDPRGGTERQVWHLIQSIDRSRYEPSITLLRNSEYIQNNGFPCEVAVLGISKLVSLSSIYKLLRFTLVLRQKDYRIVHCFFNDVSLIAPPLCRMFGIRVLVSRRDMGFWHNPWMLVALRLVSRLVDRYVVNSQAVKRVVQDREHAAAKNISVIYNGYVSPTAKSGGVADVSKRLGFPEDAPVIGIVANLRPIKRVDTLVEAFAAVQLHFPDARLVIVGDTQSEQAKWVLEALKELSRRLGVHDRIVFTGSVNDSAFYVNRFTVAVLCSESEGFSNALIEYMQAGRPIICTDTGGNPELVQDGTNGFLVPVGDVDALADRLVKLLSDIALAQKLGEAARETVHSNYSNARMISEHMACYDDVLFGSRFNRGFKTGMDTRRC